MKFCPDCGVQNVADARFCADCGSSFALTAPTAPATVIATPAPVPPPAAAPAAPVPTAFFTEPTAHQPVVPYTPAPPPARRSPLPAIGGLLALLLVAAGVAFLFAGSDDDDDDASTSTVAASVTTVAVTTTAATPTTTPPTTAEPAPATAAPTTPPDAASQLTALRDADFAAVETLVGSWVPQVSSKRVGTEADGIVYTLDDIVTNHQTLRDTYGALLLFSGDYNYTSTDLWVSIVPIAYPTPDAALTFCTDNGIDRDNCFAKLITHDMTLTDTAVFQPG